MPPPVDRYTNISIGIGISVGVGFGIGIGVGIGICMYVDLGYAPSSQQVQRYVSTSSIAKSI